MGNTSCTTYCDCSATDQPLTNSESPKKQARNNKFYEYGRISSRNDRFHYFNQFSSRNIKELFKFELCIGSGHYGKVHKAHCHFDPSKKFAIKTINKTTLSNRQIARLIQELDILQQLDHPNLVKFHGCFNGKLEIHIVMELCEGGEVFELLDKEGPFNEQQVSCIMK